MALIHLSSPHLSQLQFRQTPHGDGLWQDHQFVFDDPSSEAEWLVVYDRPASGLNCRVPKERRILMVSEPPEFQNYTERFVDQFGMIYAPQSLKFGKDRFVQGQSALPWFYGMEIGGHGAGTVTKGWDELAAPTTPLSERRWELTAICSDKKQTKNQIRRLRFLNILKEQLGDRLRIFGRGFEVLDDKAEVIENSQHHLVLENNLLPYGWTEKMADPILGGAFPFHGGAREITSDFNPDGLEWVDMTRPRESVRKILDYLDSKRAFEPDTDKAMQLNKKKLMHEHNLFAVIASLIENSDSNPVNVQEPDGVAGPAARQAIQWSRQPWWQRRLKTPKMLNRLIWEGQVRLLERS